MRQRNINLPVIPSVLLCLVLMPAIGNALDFTIEPRIQAGIMDYEFEQKSAVDTTDPDVTTTNHGFKIVSVMPFIGAGATLFANRFFLDFYVQKALSGSDRASNPLDLNFEEEDLFDFTINTIIDSELERDEFSVSIGYALGRQWALFGGYRKSTTSFSDDLVFDEKLPSVSFTGAGNREVDFKQDGFFLGGVYVLPIGNYSGLSFSAALANFDGKYDSRGNLTTEIIVEGEGAPDKDTFPTGILFDGDTIGLNLGVNWRGRIFESLNYTLGVDGYSYDFDAKKVQEFTDGTNSVAADLSESVLRFSAGLSYQF